MTVRLIEYLNSYRFSAQFIHNKVVLSHFMDKLFSNSRDAVIANILLR